MTAVRALACAALLAGCLQTKSGALRCEDGESCPAGRICVEGWCIATAEIDAGGNDAPSSDATSCPNVCDRCESGVCVLDCSASDSCGGENVCPPDVDCRIDCDGPDSCGGLIDCTANGGCVINCTGSSTCTNAITCAGGECVITCSGDDSCSGAIDCAAACACSTECSGSDTCQGALLCHPGGPCLVGNECRRSNPQCDDC